MVNIYEDLIIKKVQKLVYIHSIDIASIYCYSRSPAFIRKGKKVKIIIDAHISLKLCK